MTNLLVTGGCGFIGSNFVRFWLGRHEGTVVVLDRLTYAGRRENLHDLRHDPRLTLVVGDVGDLDLVRSVCSERRTDLIVHFAAETHVDRSILGPLAFTETNVRGTHVLLEVARELGLRLHHVGTDEVYGDVPAPSRSVEDDPLRPRSPYAASKAAADALALAYHATYGLRVTITRGANTVGPYQHPEKVVPLFATNALLGLPLPVYGDGRQIRDYTHVDDHCAGIETALLHGRPGEVYNVGSGHELSNMEMVDELLATLGASPSLVRHVRDRPGHDRRYAMNVDRLRALGWAPRFTPREAVALAARWYAEHRPWWEAVRNADFDEYLRQQYGHGSDR